MLGSSNGVYELIELVFQGEADGVGAGFGIQAGGGGCGGPWSDPGGYPFGPFGGGEKPGGGCGPGCCVMGPFH